MSVVCNAIQSDNDWSAGGWVDFQCELSLKCHVIGFACIA